LEQVNFQESWCDGASNSASPSTPMALENGEVGPKNGSTAIVPWCRLHAEKQMQTFNLPSAEEEGKGSSGAGATAPCQQQLTSTSFLLSKFVLSTLQIAYCSTQMISYKKHIFAGFWLVLLEIFSFTGAIPPNNM